MRGSAMIQVTLTETAASKVKELIQRSDPETGQPLGSLEDTYLRMYVAGGGCSGFRYGLALDRKIHEDDEVVQVHGLKVPSTATARNTSMARAWTTRKASRGAASS